MNTRRDFAIQLAAMIPFESHVRALNEAINDYLETPTEELKGAILTGALLLTMNGAIQDKDPEELIQDLNRREEANNFLKTSKN